MFAEPETHAPETWQDSLVLELLSRLLQPLSRPGVVSLAVTRRILGWLSYLDGRIALSTEIARRRGRGPGLLSNPMPIVHARWMPGAEGRAEVGEALRPTKPAEALPIVRATAMLAGGEAPGERARTGPAPSPFETSSSSEVRIPGAPPPEPRTVAGGASGEHVVGETAMARAPALPHAITVPPVHIVSHGEPQSPSAQPPTAAVVPPAMSSPPEPGATIPATSPLPVVQASAPSPPERPLGPIAARPSELPVEASPSRPTALAATRPPPEPGAVSTAARPPSIVQATAPSPPEPTPALVATPPLSVQRAARPLPSKPAATEEASPSRPVVQVATSPKAEVSAPVTPTPSPIGHATTPSPAEPALTVDATTSRLVVHALTPPPAEPGAMITAAPPPSIERSPTLSPREPTPALAREISRSSAASIAAQQASSEPGHATTEAASPRVVEHSNPELQRTSGHEALVAPLPEQTAVVHAATPATPHSTAIVAPIVQPTPPRSSVSQETTRTIIMPPVRRRPAAVQASPATPPILERAVTQVHAPERVLQAHPRAPTRRPMLEVDSPSPAAPSAAISQPESPEQSRSRPVVIGRGVRLTERDVSSDPVLLHRRTAEEPRVLPKSFTPPANAERLPSPTPALRGARPVVMPSTPGFTPNAPSPRPALVQSASAASAPLPRALARPASPSPVLPQGNVNITPALAPPARNIPATTKATAPAASPPAPTAPTVAPAGRGNVDIDVLAEKVQRKILRQLAAERERKGSLR